MIRKFLLRAWYALACVFVVVFGGCVVLLCALCSGFKGFVCYFCDTIKTSVNVFIDSFDRAANISQRCG